MPRCCVSQFLCFTPLIFVLGVQLNAFTVRWGGSYNGYYEMPLTMAEALGQQWAVAGFHARLKAHLVSHHDDPRFYLMFDRKGTIAGVMFGFPKEDVNRVMLVDGRYNYTFPDTMFKSAKHWGSSIWYTCVLFAEPDVIRAGRPNLNMETDDVVSSLHYWADSDWHQVARMERDVTDDLSEQGCYPGMGKHYYYKTDQSTICKEWQGFFATYDQGSLSGFGISVFGSFVSTYFTTTYYEYPAFHVVRNILPNRPLCVDEWLPNTGVTSVHVFLKADAANITCPRTDPEPNVLLV